MKNVSIKDIAKMAGVNPSTVSLVLNGKAKQMRISDSLSKRIQTFAKQAGYQPNHIAVSLRKGSTKILGLIVEDISNNFFACLAKVIEDEVQLLGYRAVYCSTENNIEKGQDLINMLFQRQVDGYLITPTAGMEKNIRQLVQQHKPVVLIDRYFPGLNVPYVVIDNYAGALQGMEYLIKKGYRKIAFVTVDLPLIQMKERERAYIETLQRHKMPVNKQMILKLHYADVNGKTTAEITSFIKNNTAIDAIFFATNYLGIAGLESIKELELKIPNELAVICFDDHDVFKLYTPAITCIKQPIEDIAKTAIQFLMKQMNSGVFLSGMKAVLNPVFIERQSA
ncbi:MAG: substrate-binding domain-containing protein [Parafilimonas sp.]